MIGNKKAVCNHEWVYECLCIIYHNCTLLKSCSKLIAALGTILLHENLSLFSKTILEAFKCAAALLTSMTFGH